MRVVLLAVNAVLLIVHLVLIVHFIFVPSPSVILSIVGAIFSLWVVLDILQSMKS